MKQYITFLLIGFMVTLVHGQKGYQVAMNQGDSAYKQEKYKLAIKKYFAAEAFDPTKTELIREKLNRTYDAIVTLKEKAEREHNKAIKAQQAVFEEREKADKKIAALLIHLSTGTWEYTDPTVALLLEVEAQKIFDLPVIQENMDMIRRNNAIYKVMGHSDRIRSFDRAYITPEFIVSAYDDNKIRLMKYNDTLITEFVSADEEIKAVAFSPVDSTILTGSSKGDVRLYDWKGQQLAAMKHGADRINTVNFSPDGNFLLAGSLDRSAAVWDLTGDPVAMYSGHGGHINKIKYDPVFKRIITASSDGKVYLWDIEGELIARFNVGYADTYAIAFSPDGKRIIGGGTGGVVSMWNIENIYQKLIKARFTSGGETLKRSPDGSRIIRFEENTAIIVEANSGNPIAKLQGSFDETTSAAFSPDGTKIVTASTDEIARIWDANTGDLLLSLEGHTSWISSAVFSPDGENVLTASFDGTVKIWSLNGLLIKELLVTAGGVWTANYSPDGSRIVTGGTDNKTQIWNVKSGRLIMELADQTSDVFKASFTPDMSAVRTITINGLAKVWDLKSGEIIDRYFEELFLPADLSYYGHSNSILSLAFSPDGSKVLSGSSDNTVQVWDLDGKTKATFLGHKAAVGMVAFTGNNDAFTLSDDRIVRSWTWSEGGPVYPLEQFLECCVDPLTEAQKEEYLRPIEDDIKSLIGDGQGVREQN